MTMRTPTAEVLLTGGAMMKAADEIMSSMGGLRFDIWGKFIFRRLLAKAEKRIARERRTGDLTGTDEDVSITVYDAIEKLIGSMRDQAPSSSSVLTKRALDLALFSVCPGLWPFC